MSYDMDSEKQLQNFEQDQYKQAAVQAWRSKVLLGPSYVHLKGSFFFVSRESLGFLKQ